MAFFPIKIQTVTSETTVENLQHSNLAKAHRAPVFTGVSDFQCPGSPERFLEDFCNVFARQRRSEDRPVRGHADDGNGYMPRATFTHASNIMRCICIAQDIFSPAPIAKPAIFYPSSTQTQSSLSPNELRNGRMLRLLLLQSDDEQWAPQPFSPFLKEEEQVSAYNFSLFCRDLAKTPTNLCIFLH